MKTNNLGKDDFVVHNPERYSVQDKSFIDQHDTLMALLNQGVIDEFKVKVVLDKNGIYQRCFVTNPGKPEEEIIGLYPTDKVIGCLYPFRIPGPDLGCPLNNYKRYVERLHLNARKVAREHFNEYNLFEDVHAYNHISRHRTIYHTGIVLIKKPVEGGFVVVSFAEHDNRYYPLDTVFVEGDSKDVRY